VRLEQTKVMTERLALRAFEAGDAADVQRLAGEWDVARTTLNIPHPYNDGMAEAWIASHQKALDAGTNIVYAVTDRQQGT